LSDIILNSGIILLHLSEGGGIKDYIVRHAERMAGMAVAWREKLLKSLAPPELRGDFWKMVEFLTENGVGFAMESGREYLFMQGYCLGRVHSMVTVENNILRFSMVFDPNDTTQLSFPVMQVGKSLRQK